MAQIPNQDAIAHPKALPRWGSRHLLAPQYWVSVGTSLKWGRTGFDLRFDDRLHAEDDSLASLKIESKKSIANQELALAA